MTIKKLNEILQLLQEKFNPDYNIEILSDDEIIVFYSTKNGENREIKINIDELLNQKKEINPNDISWDGISRVRSWSGGGKERIYFNVIGVSESLHKRGKIFLELVLGSWIPNMKYSLMTNFANQLNQLEIYDGEKVEELYQSWIEQF